MEAAYTDAQIDYARGVGETLTRAGVRVIVAAENEMIGAKIRKAQLQKVPYMLIVGAKEAQAGSAAVRSRAKGDEGAVPLDQFLARLRQEIDQKF